MKKTLNTIPDEDFLTLHQAALLLGVSKTSLFLWTKRGEIKSYAVDRYRIYRRSDLEQFNNRNKK